MPGNKRWGRNKEGDPSEKYGGVLKHYEPTMEDILLAIEKHGREISLTKLQMDLVPVAHEHHFKYVNWKHMKMTVLGMVVAGMLIKKPQMQGYYRYDLPNRHGA